MFVFRSMLVLLSLGAVLTASSADCEKEAPAATEEDWVSFLQLTSNSKWSGDLETKERLRDGWKNMQKEQEHWTKLFISATPHEEEKIRLKEIDKSYQEWATQTGPKVLHTWPNPCKNPWTARGDWVTQMNRLKGWYAFKMSGVPADSHAPEAVQYVSHMTKWYSTKLDDHQMWLVWLDNSFPGVNGSSEDTAKFQFTPKAPQAPWWPWFADSAPAATAAATSLTGHASAEHDNGAELALHWQKDDDDDSDDEENEDGTLDAEALNPWNQAARWRRQLRDWHAECNESWPMGSNESTDLNGSMDYEEYYNDCGGKIGQLESRLRRLYEQCPGLNGRGPPAECSAVGSETCRCAKEWWPTKAMTRIGTLEKAVGPSDPSNPPIPRRLWATGHFSKSGSWQIPVTTSSNVTLLAWNPWNYRSKLVYKVQQKQNWCNYKIARGKSGILCLTRLAALQARLNKLDATFPGVNGTIGTCSDNTYITESTCSSGGGAWTPMQYAPGSTTQVNWWNTSHPWRQNPWWSGISTTSPSVVMPAWALACHNAPSAETLSNTTWHRPHRAWNPWMHRARLVNKIDNGNAWLAFNEQHGVAQYNPVTVKQITSDRSKLAFFDEAFPGADGTSGKDYSPDNPSPKWWPWFTR